MTRTPAAAPRAPAPRAEACRRVKGDDVPDDFDELFLENGDKATLRDVTRWFLGHYEGLEHLTEGGTVDPTCWYTVTTIMRRCLKRIEAAAAPGQSWRCPKCRRWQSKTWSRCRSEHDTGIACDGVHAEPAAAAGE